MAPLREWEEDLKELSSYQPTARRIFWTGANPFVMSFDNLKTRALLVHEYLKECQTMAMFANIRDIKDKKVKQLRALRRLGINGLSIGTESGDNATLRLANKGYTAKDIIDQCRKLDEAGIEYYFVYMTGLAGKGNGHRNAVNSAKVFSKVNPRFISVDSLTLFEGTELYEMAERGEFVPAGEKEEKKGFFKKKKDPRDEKIEDLTDRVKRQMAEFENFRKRSEKEKSTMYEMGARDIIERMLPVIDNFERGLATVPEDEKGSPIAEGMEKIYKQFQKTLEEAGVKPIEAVGQEFDPNFHNAVMHVDDDSLGENIVAEELQKGYMYRESVVRHSMVKVAN